MHLNSFVDKEDTGEEGRRSAGSCLPDLRSCLPVTLVVHGCVASVRRTAACLVSPPSLPFRVGILFFLSIVHSCSYDIKIDYPFGIRLKKRSCIKAE